MTLCGGVLFASWKLLQFPSSWVCDSSCNFYSGFGPTGIKKTKTFFREASANIYLQSLVLDIAALTSPRTNLSPFTKGCRDRGALMRLTNFWRDLFPTIHRTRKTFFAKRRNIKNSNTRTVAYLLGLLAMIKCSICSYQYDNWYARKSSTSVHKIFIGGSD